MIKIIVIDVSIGFDLIRYLVFSKFISNNFKIFDFVVS